MKTGWHKQGRFLNTRPFHLCTDCGHMTSHPSQLCDNCFMDKDEPSGTCPVMRGATRSRGMYKIEERESI